MIYLLVHILTVALFSLCYKTAERKDGFYTPAVHLVLCLVSFGVSIFIASVQEGFVSDWRLIALGVGGGLCFLVAIRPFFMAMAQGGLAVGWTFINLAIVIPLAASILLWDETPGPFQIIGLLFMIPCVILFGDLRLQVQGDQRRWVLLVILASIATGLTQSANKALVVLSTEYADHGTRQIIFNYLGWMFGTGGVGLVFLGELKRCRLRSPETTTGVIMGMLNICGGWAFIKALEVLPGIVFFPLKAICGVIVTAILAVLIYKERLTKRQVTGILFGAAAAMLLNIRT